MVIGAPQTAPNHPVVMYTYYVHVNVTGERSTHPPARENSAARSCQNTLKNGLSRAAVKALAHDTPLIESETFLRDRGVV